MAGYTYISTFDRVRWTRTVVCFRAGGRLSAFRLAGKGRRQERFKTATEDTLPYSCIYKLLLYTKFLETIFYSVQVVIKAFEQKLQPQLS